ADGLQRMTRTPSLRKVVGWCQAHGLRPVGGVSGNFPHGAQPVGLALTTSCQRRRTFHARCGPVLNSQTVLPVRSSSRTCWLFVQATRVLPLGRRVAEVGVITAASQTALPSWSYSTTRLFWHWAIRMRPLGRTSRPPRVTLPTGKLFSSLPAWSS